MLKMYKSIYDALSDEARAVITGSAVGPGLSPPADMKAIVPSAAEPEGRECPTI
jgi:hypothetical protein